RRPPGSRPGGMRTLSRPAPPPPRVVSCSSKRSSEVSILLLPPCGTEGQPWTPSPPALSSSGVNRTLSIGSKSEMTPPLAAHLIWLAPLLALLPHRPQHLGLTVGDGE